MFCTFFPLLSFLIRAERFGFAPVLSVLLSYLLVVINVRE